MIRRATDTQIQYIRELQELRKEGHRDWLRGWMIRADPEVELWATAAAWISFLTRRGITDYSNPHAVLTRTEKVLAYDEAYTIREEDFPLYHNPAGLVKALLEDIRIEALGYDILDTGPPRSLPDHEEFQYTEQHRGSLYAALDAQVITEEDWEWLGIEPMDIDWGPGPEEVDKEAFEYLGLE